MLQGRARRYPRSVSPERRWWRNAVLVLRRPREVFRALRDSDGGGGDDDEIEARQEPALAIVLLAGMASMLATPTAGRLLDERAFDWVLVAVWTFVGGSLFGAVAYALGGLVLWLGVRGMGSFETEWRSVRHVLAYALVPLASSLPVLLAVRLAAFGGDAFRSGGADAGAAGAAVQVLQGVFVLWALGLLVLGLRVVYGFTWARAAGTFALVALFLAALFSLSASL